jgi:hypothetical protein
MLFGDQYVTHDQQHNQKIEGRGYQSRFGDFSIDNWRV